MSGPLLPPRIRGPLPDLAERGTWTLDALDALAEARGRRLKDRGDSRFGTVYMAVVAVALAAAMGGSLTSRMLRGCGGTACAGLSRESSMWLGVAIVLGTVGAVMAGAHAVGPAGLSPARRSWFASSPGDRVLAVRQPLAAIVLCGAVLGACGGIGTALAMTVGLVDGGAMTIGAAVGLAGGVATSLGAVLVQGTPSARVWWMTGWLLLIAGALVAALAVNVAGIPAIPQVSPLLVVTPLLALLVIGSLVARRLARPRIRAMSFAELRRGGDAVEATVSSLLMLETGALDNLRGARAREARGRFRSRPLRGRADIAIVSADARRLLRGRTPLIVAALLLPLPVILRVLIGPAVAMVFVALLGLVVGNGAASGLRLWTRSSSVRRMFPFSEPRVRLAHLVVPAVLAGTWLAAACALTGEGILSWACLTTAALAGVLRSAPQASAGIAAGQVQQSPMGAIPVGLVSFLLRGPDVAALPVLLLIADLPDAGFMLALAFLLAFAWRSDTRPR